MNTYLLTGYCPNRPEINQITVTAANEKLAWLKAMTEHGMLAVYESKLIKKEEV